MSTALGTAWAGDAHERWAELAVGHALHALEPDDEADFLAHLRGCAACHLVVEDTTAVAGELAFGAGPEAPPEGLRRRLREATGAEAPAHAAVDAAADAAVDPPAPASDEGPGTPEPVFKPLRALPGPAAADPRGDGPAPDRAAGPAVAARPGSHRAPRAPRVPRAPRRPGEPRRPGGLGRAGGVVPWLATAAAVVGLVAVVATGAGVRAERDRLATAMAAQEAVLDRLTDPDAAVVRLGPTRGGAESDGPGMTAAVLMDGGEAWVVTDGLPPNDPAATTYVLWALPQAGDPVPMGVFDVTAGGLQVAGLGAPGAAVGDPPGDLALGDLAAVAVSREDGRTAPPAPSTPLLVGTPA